MHESKNRRVPGRLAKKIYKEWSSGNKQVNLHHKFGLAAFGAAARQLEYLARQTYKHQRLGLPTLILEWGQTMDIQH